MVLFGHLEAMLGADPDSPATAELRRRVKTADTGGQSQPPPTAGLDRPVLGHKRLPWAHTRALCTFIADDDAALVALVHTHGLLRH